MPKERPILFSAPMVRAILDGRKTQTRRVVNMKDIDYHGAGGKDSPEWNDPRFWGYEDEHGRWHMLHSDQHGRGDEYQIPCHYGQPGDLLWVRESGWERPDRTERMLREGADTWAPYYYVADGRTCLSDREQFAEWGFRRVPSIHMPRWASRITLRVVSVRVERLRDISEEDAKAEGVEPYHCPHADALVNAVGGGLKPIPYTSGFANLWNEINAKRGFGWDQNPWVWVVEFNKERI